MAGSMAAIGRLDTAVTILRDIDSRIPDQVEIVSNLASYLARQRDYEQAEKEFRRLCRLYPDYVPGWYGLGNVLVHKGDTAGAVEAYRSTRSLDSTYLGVDSILRALDPMGFR
jgi:Flp pilus assembly protein TadD